MVEQIKLHTYIYSTSLAILTLIIAITVFWPGLLGKTISAYSHPQKKLTGTEMLTPGAIQDTDSKIGQYKERSNASIQATQSPKGTKTVSAFSGAAAVILAPGCALSFSVTPQAKTIAPDGIITYDFLLQNNGLETCVNVSFSTYYEDNEAFVSVTKKATSGNYYWNIGSLASESSYTLTLTTKNVSGGDNTQVHNETCATADNSSDVCANTLIFVLSENQPIPPPAPMLVPPPTPAPPPVTPTPPPSNQVLTPDNNEFGTWIWDSPMQMSSSYRDTILSAAQTNGINVVYVTIDDYLDIAILPEGQSKDLKKKAYETALAQFIAAANAKGIVVDVEGGWRDWANSENRWKGYALIDFVKGYNQKNPSAKVRNFQYDVEPYLLSSYEKKKNQLLLAFVEFIDESATRMQSVNAGFSVVIPHFYDSLQKWTPQITYQGTTAYTYTQLLRVLEKKKGSNIIIMAYRDFFEGANGTRQISEPEIIEASNGGYSTKVIVAQETGNVSPDYVTFYNQPKSDLMSALSDIRSTFGGYRSFRGVAVHYIDAFLELR